jgi:phosphoribosyl-AMP cyclohydrolase
MMAKNNNSKAEIEEGLEFHPKFDDKGLIPCIVSSHLDNTVLMLAYMNSEALRLSIETGEAHYWSRSRNEIWHKGATSGQVQKITEMKTDCDQDCILITVDMPKTKDTAKEISCHTGRRSCFYRHVKSMEKLEF